MTLLKVSFCSLNQHRMVMIRDIVMILSALVSISDETLPGGKDS